MTKPTLKNLSIKSEKLAKARKKAGLSQAEAARLLGVKRGTVWNYENGKALPSADVLMRMLILYDLSAGSLADVSARQVLFFRQNVS